MGGFGGEGGGLVVVVLGGLWVVGWGGLGMVVCLFGIGASRSSSLSSEVEVEVGGSGILGLC